MCRKNQEFISHVLQPGVASSDIMDIRVPFNTFLFHPHSCDVLMVQMQSGGRKTSRIWLTTEEDHCFYVLCNFKRAFRNSSKNIQTILCSLTKCVCELNVKS